MLCRDEAVYLLISPLRVRKDPSGDDVGSPEQLSLSQPIETEAANTFFMTIGPTSDSTASSTLVVVEIK